YRLASFDTSGSIAFIGDDQNVADPAYPARREELAHALERIAQSDVDRVYIDIVFDRPSTASADARLAAAIHALGDRAYLVQKYLTRVDGERVLNQTIDGLAGGARQVGKDTYINYLGHVWNAPWSM